MGLDLRLLPVDGDHPPNVFYSHTMLSLHRATVLGLVQEIARRHGVEIPMPLWTFTGSHACGEQGYGEIETDPYGDRLKYVLAVHLKPVAEAYGIIYDALPEKKRNTSWKLISGDVLAPKKTRKPVEESVKVPSTSINPRDGMNRAAFAYICALPDDYKIVLYWH